MSEHQPQASTSPTARRWPVVVSAIVLLVEVAGVTSLTLWEGIGIVTAHPDSLSAAIALFVLGVIAVAWGAATAVGLLRVQRWSRGSAITWQVLQFAVGVGCFQGFYARADIGWALCLPAVVVVVVLMVPAATRVFEAAARTA